MSFKRIFIPWGIVSWWRCPRSLLSKESFAVGMPLLSLQRILTRDTQANFPNRIVPSLLESSVLCLLWSILSFYWAWCGMGIFPKLKERNSLSIADACGHLPDTIHASSPINLVLCAKLVAFKGDEANSIGFIPIPNRGDSDNSRLEKGIFQLLLGRMLVYVGLRSLRS